MSALSPPPSVRQLYGEQIGRCAEQIERLRRLDRLLTHVRVIVFLCGAAAAVAALQFESASQLWWLCTAAVFIGFVGLVGFHERVRGRMDSLRLLRDLHREALARIARNWERLPVAELEVPDRHGALAIDLDLFGRASLFQLLSTASTSMGTGTLRDWLLEPAAGAEIRARQQAVVELTPLQEFRDQFLVEGRLLSRATDHPERFVAWAEGERWLARRPWLRRWTRLSPAMLSIVLLLTCAGLLPAQESGTAMLGLVLANCLLSIFFTARVHDTFATLATRHRELERYHALFELLDRLTVTAPRLQQVQRAARAGAGALAALRQLGRYLWLAQRDQSALKFLLRLVLQLTLLWDFHVLWLLERWQQRQGRQVRHWFQALGEFEAFLSMSQLAHDHPAWAFPRIDERETRLQARELGHPLLADETRVGNDVEVGPPGTFLLVTGSNMSGKSTLLRAIGLNVILAQAGAPVCALSMSLPPLVVQTSMRIRDSLTAGVSFFLAELKRLKEIVDRADALRGNPNECLLYLLDEILLGTNSRDRQVAVVRVLSHLLRSGALGAISTHDLGLADCPELHDACLPVHFTETLHGPQAERPMTFDFKLRPGIATTTNALKLVEMVGLD